MTTRVKADWFVHHASDLVNDKFHGTFAECEDWLHENQRYAVTHVHFYNNVIVVVNRFTATLYKMSVNGRACR
jgi:hypothetical protein